MLGPIEVPDAHSLAEVCWQHTAQHSLYVTSHHRLKRQSIVLLVAGAVPACLILATPFSFIQQLAASLLLCINNIFVIISSSGSSGGGWQQQW